MLDRRLNTWHFDEDRQWYVARCLEVEVASQGESLDQALDNLREALELYFEDVDLTELPVTPILVPMTVELPDP